MHNKETSQKKAFYNSNIEKVVILHVLHKKGAPLMRRARNCDQNSFRKVWTI